MREYEVNICVGAMENHCVQEKHSEEKKVN